MPWTTPRVWVVAAVSTTQMNEVSEQLAVLHKGNGHTSLTTVEPGVNRVLDVGETDQTFNVSGNTQLSFITTAGREPGNTIHLIKETDACIFGYGQTSPPSGSLPIYGNGVGTSTISWQPGRMITLTLGETAWHHDCYSS